MPITELYVPQLGEGLQEVLIRDLLKKPGEKVSRDEPIYRVETDKAVVDMESPCDGIVEKWLAKVDDVVAIGSAIVQIQTTGQEASLGTQSVDANKNLDDIRRASHQHADRASAVRIPPRTRAYCRQLGLEETEIPQIPASSGSLLPSDVDLYLQNKPKAGPAKPAEEGAAEKPNADYSDRSLSSQQKALMFRLSQSARKVVAATVSRPIQWQRINDIVATLTEKKIASHASDFQVFAYCVAQACKTHPRFRSNLIGNSTVREYKHVNLGVAVSRPDDELITAVVANADRFELPEFLDTLKRQIRRAWQSGDQATSSTQLILSSLAALGITDGVPALASPATAILFIGASYEGKTSLMANLSITFDHRLVNGAGAAKFINAIDLEINKLQLTLL